MADLPNRFRLIVVTRERKIVDLEVDEVLLPGSEGELGILPGHAPLLAMLKVGQLRYRVGNNITRLVVTWGFAEVLPDRVTVVAQKGTLAEEIDLAAAERERAEAEKELAYLSSHDPEFTLAEGRLEESIALINIGSSHH